MMNIISIVSLICVSTLAVLAAAWFIGGIYDWFGGRSSKLLDSIGAARERAGVRRRLARKPITLPQEGLEGGYRDAVKPSLEEEIRALKERVAFLENAPAELDYEIEEAHKEYLKVEQNKYLEKVRLGLEPLGDQILTKKEQAKRKRNVKVVASGNWKVGNGRG